MALARVALQGVRQQFEGSRGQQTGKTGDLVLDLGGIGEQSVNGDESGDRGKDRGHGVKGDARRDQAQIVLADSDKDVLGDLNEGGGTLVTSRLGVGDLARRYTAWRTLFDCGRRRETLAYATGQEYFHSHAGSY